MPLNISSDQINEINEAANAPREFTPVPDGRYCASLVSAEDSSRVAKSGNTLDYVKCHFKLEGGEFNNRREFADLVYSNSGSPPHGEIGVKQLVSMYKALGGEGNLNVASLSALSGKCLLLVIKTSPPKPGSEYGPRRNFYYDVCDNCPTDSGAADSSESDGGDIWS